MCHGQTGNGDSAVDSGDKLPDFSIAAGMNGKGHMPHENIRVSPNELWNLVNYVRSLSK
jgi:mono/diheme cytochrome c family protein